jgi:PIN domain nuclease of toxin-antitoxin system
LATPEKLTEAVRAAIEAGPNALSVVSFWEVVLKAAKGKLLEVGEPGAWWATALSDLAGSALPLRPSHVAEICHLPPVHQDPFDRALVAQAIVEGLALVTTDALIRGYAGHGLQVVT